MFNPGDWVVNTYGSIGYIEQVYNNQVKVKLVCNKLGGKINQTNFYYFNEILPAPIESYYSLAQLDSAIDLALDTGDKEWFAELSKRRDLIGQA